jgi:transmembrane sensor
MGLAFDHMDDLIGKVLAGEATAAEKREVEEWCRAQKENQDYFNSVSTVFEKAASSNIQLQFNTDAAWQKVKQRLRPEVKVVPMKSAAAFNWPALRIAAGVVLVLVTGVFAYRWWTQPTQTLAVVSDATTVQDTLPDGSTAFLNKKSSISYEYNPRQKTRNVKLKGEGFFEVKHEEKKPFVIETEGVFVRDIGTAFNVRSYPDKDTVEVIVESGEVQFYSLKDSGLNLKAGETGIYTKRGKVFTKIARADTNALAYKTGVFSFHSTDLRSVIDRINEVYDSDIRLGDEQLGNCRLTATFRNENIDTVVDVIAETMGLTVERGENKVIILNGPGCQ